MATTTFNITYKKNEDLIMSPSEFIEQYLYGVPLTNKDGTVLPMETIKQKILNAQSYVEHWLEIKFSKKYINEVTDFYRQEYASWGYLKTTFPVDTPLALSGFVGTVRQINYPIEWISKQRKPYQDQMFRTLHVIPAGNTTTSVPQSVIFSGITPHLGFMGFDSIPNYWTIEYTTGFSEVPGDIQDFVGKLAAIETLAILGDLIMGSGLSSVSLGLDGLSQSISSNKGGGRGAFSGRIEQYAKELETRQKFLRDRYKGLTFNVC